MEGDSCIQEMVQRGFGHSVATGTPADHSKGKTLKDFELGFGAGTVCVRLEQILECCLWDLAGSYAKNEHSVNMMTRTKQKIDRSARI